MHANDARKWKIQLHTFFSKIIKEVHNSVEVNVSKT